MDRPRCLECEDECRWCFSGCVWYCRDCIYDFDGPSGSVRCSHRIQTAQSKSKLAADYGPVKPDTKEHDSEKSDEKNDELDELDEFDVHAIKRRINT